MCYWSQLVLLEGFQWTWAMSLSLHDKKEKKEGKKKPKGYKQETIEAFYTTYYWVIVTYSLQLSCHCTLSFNKEWANIRGSFLLYQESSFGMYLMALWMLFIMLWYCNVTMNTSSLSSLHLPRHNLLARIHKFLGVKILDLPQPLCYWGISVPRHLTNSSGCSWEAVVLNFMSSFLSLRKGSCLVRLLFLAAKAVNSLTDQTAGVVPETPLPLNELEFT